MSKEWTQASVLFHNRAGEALLTLYREFRQGTASIDRQWDENVFQQQQGKYVALLKHRLELIAQELMAGQGSGSGRDEWNREVSNHIHNYLGEFRQKIRSL